jgi:hypothetical protein
MRHITLRRTLIAITFIALFTIAARTPADTDMWWHLRTGQYILDARAIPTTDPFSWTMTGTPWVDVHWLSQVILFSVYSIGGFALLALLVAALVSSAFVFVWKQLEGAVFLKAAITILAAATAAATWTPRSQMATFLFTAILSYILYLYKWKQVDRLWLVPILFAVWVNLHGGYIAGLMLLGTMMVGEGAQFIISKLGISNSEVRTTSEVVGLTWPRLRKLILIGMISIAALLINPYTIDALRLPFKTVGIGVLQDFIQEWASPNFHQLFLQPMIWLMLLTLVVIGWSRRRLDVTDALTVSLFAYITLLAQRNIGLFAIVCAPILSRHLSALFDRSGWAGRSLSRGSPSVNALLIGLIAFASAIKIAASLLPTTIDQEQRKVLPIGAADWLAQNKPNGLMFNSYNWGGYLLWRLYPQYAVYVDGRTDVYDDAFLRNYLNITSIAPDYDQRLNQAGVQFVVIESNTLLDQFLARNIAWHETYRDAQAVIYVRAKA